MADDNEQAPLLAHDPEASPSAQLRREEASETTPLLARSYHSNDDGEGEIDNGDNNGNDDNTEPGSGQPDSSKCAVRRWPSLIAALLLAFMLAGIILGAFFVPAAVEEYAKQGAVVEPTNLSLESITADGVRARIQANFRLDGSRVHNQQVRRIGRAATWLVGRLGTETTVVRVYLPDLGGLLLGSAAVPPMTISVVDGHTTALDFVAELAPGDAEGLRSIANQWLEGRLDNVRIQGQADISLKAGPIPLGTHAVSESLVFEASDLPALPEYTIDRINFRDVDIPGHSDMAMGVEVAVSAYNDFPFQLDVPELAFDILVPDCNPLDAYIRVADAVTGPIAVRPHALVTANVSGTMLEFPESLTALCPGSESSPLDLLLKQYLSGDAATVFVRGRAGSGSPKSPGTPGWLADILASVTVPVPFPGRTFDNLIRGLSLTDVHFSLPDPMADPDDPGATSPTVSGTIVVTAGLPAEMNFAINVTHVRANADVFYQDGKLGELNLHRWQPANSTMHRPSPDDGDGEKEATLTIQSRIADAPLTVTDADVFSDVIQKLIFDGQQVDLDINALVDIRVVTVLGQLQLKDVPAAGKIPIKPILNAGPLDSLVPRVGNINILDTTPSSLTLEAAVNVTNPTDYTAHIPFISIQVLCNGTLVGIARAEHLDVTTGNNTNLLVGATWNPSLDGENGLQVGRNLLSQYISGINTTLTLRLYRESIPFLPIIGEALSKFSISFPTPSLQLPEAGDGGDGGDGDKKTKPHSFIREATFHFFSSTASFVLLSPLAQNTLYVEAIDATAYYNHTEPIGNIRSDVVFAAPPGLSHSPKLPVEWSPDSVGFDKLRKALGGDLWLDARANVSVRLGTWRETIWYEGQGIGAHVRP